MAEPRRIGATVVTLAEGGRGKSQRDLDAQMSRIQRALGDERYLNIERYTTADGRRGMNVSQNARGNELFSRAQQAYINYSRNIASEVNPGRPDYETPWLTEEQRNRRVPRSVYMRNNRS